MRSELQVSLHPGHSGRQVQRVFFSYLLRKLKLQFVIKILTLSKSRDTFSLRLLKNKAACLVFFRWKGTTFVTAESEFLCSRSSFAFRLFLLSLVRKMYTSLLSVLNFHWPNDELDRLFGQSDSNMVRDPFLFLLQCSASRVLKRRSGKEQYVFRSVTYV